MWLSTRETDESFHGRRLTYERRGDAPNPPGPDAGAGGGASAKSLPAGFGGLPVPGTKATPKGKHGKAPNPKAPGPANPKQHGVSGKTPEQAAKAEARLHYMDHFS